MISRHHCAIVVDQSYVAIRDFGSKNGTYVNNERSCRRVRVEVGRPTARRTAGVRDYAAAGRVGRQERNRRSTIPRKPPSGRPPDSRKSKTSLSGWPIRPARRRASSTRSAWRRSIRSRSNCRTPSRSLFLGPGRSSCRSRQPSRHAAPPHAAPPRAAPPRAAPPTRSATHAQRHHTQRLHTRPSRTQRLRVQHNRPLPGPRRKSSSTRLMRWWPVRRRFNRRLLPARR